MDDAVFYPAMILSGLAIALHLAWCALAKRPTSLATLVTCMLHSAGVVVGGALILSTVDATLRQRLQHIGFYIALGGLAVLFVSLQGVISAIRPRR